MSFLSIVMPVFNAERTLQRAIGSILNQSFSDFELLVVDDCSTDASLQLCRAFDDTRIRLIEMKSNSGVAAARNAALEMLKGEYVTFVDADDWLEDDWLARAARCLIEDASIDCLKCGCSEDYFDGNGQLTYRKICHVDEERLDERAAINRKIVRLESVPLFGYIWNGFYRAEIIRRFALRFDAERRVNEDFFFNMEFFRHARVFRTLDSIGYHYEKRGGGSLSSTATNYGYAINRQKIAALVGLFDGEISAESARLIFWMYTRFCYAALVGGESMSIIRNDKLFRRFQSIEFGSVGVKRRMMIELLRNKMFSPILSTAVKLIGGVQKCAPSLFARLKH